MHRQYCLTAMLSKAGGCCNYCAGNRLESRSPEVVQVQCKHRSLHETRSEQSLCGVSRQLRERHTKLEDFASWLGLLRRVQAGEVGRLQQEETALAVWDMYLPYGAKPMLELHQDKFDEMKEESAVFTKVCKAPTCPRS